MASTIKLKSSTTASNAPSTLAQGEFAINVADGNLFYGDGSSVKQNFVFDELTVKGNLTAENYIVSSSVTYMTQSFSSGSTIFGDTQDDTHQFTGSVDITGSLTVDGITFPIADGDNGDVLITDGAGNLSFTRTTVYANVKNVHGSELVKGMPVHVTGAAGNTSEVVAASASNAATMPAHFILNETLADDAEGLAIAVGYINQVNTGDFNEGDTVYVGANGGYTNVKPTGSNLIQNLGIVDKVHASNGSGFILGAGRSNDVPNISDGYAWVGNSDSVATAVATSSFVVDNANTASYVAADNIAQPFSTFEVDGPSNSHVEVGTYPIGYDTIPFSGFFITGSGLIISGAMADSNHHNFLKIGEIEIVDVKNSLNANALLIHNVDDFILVSGSDGGNIVSSNLLFRHQGNAFDIYQNGSSKISMNGTGDLSFSGTNITFSPTTATKMKATNTTATNTYILTAEGNPNSTPQSLKSVNAQDFFRTVTGAVTASIVSASDGVIGDLTGNADTATTATTATNATNLNVGNSDGSSTYFILSALGSGNQAVKRISGFTFEDAKNKLNGVENIEFDTDTGISHNTFGNLVISGSTSLILDVNNEYLIGTLTGGAKRNIAGINASDEVEIGNASSDAVSIIGNTTIDGTLAIDGIANVSASIAAAGGGGTPTSYRTQVVSNGFYSQADKRYLTFNTTGETTGFNYLSLMPAPADGRVISISVWPQSSGGSTVMGFHLNSNATAASTDTQTLTAGTPVTFTFSSGNTFSQNDELSFSIDPLTTPNGLFFSIILEYDY